MRKKHFFKRFIKDFFGAVAMLSMVGTAGIIIYWLVRLTIYNVELGTIVSGIVFLATIVAIRVWNEKEEVGAEPSKEEDVKSVETTE